MMRKFRPGETLWFTYKNHAGKVEGREVIFMALAHGNNEYHTERCWMLHGYCINRKDYRSFVLSDISNLRNTPGG